MRDAMRSVARQLGLTVYFTTLLVLVIAAVVAAKVWGVELLYGVAVVLAIVAGNGWRREVPILCEECEQAMETVEA